MEIKGKKEEIGVIKKPDSALGIRHLEAFLLLTGLMLAYAMRANMSVAIVAMTEATSTFADIPTFPEWSKQTQDVILSSFFWGYVVMQIPCGIIAHRYGEKVLMAVAIFGNAIALFVTPVAAINGGWQAVCACRVLQGLTQAAVFPSLQGQLGKWVPISERSRLSTYVNAGSSLGTVIELALAGIIGDSYGWPMIFYTLGVAGVIWTAFWLFLSADSPGQHRWISEEERAYIEGSSGHSNSKKTGKTPWKSILTSVPFWALLVVHSGNNWGFFTLFTETPSYLSQVLGVDVKTNGLLSALPYLAAYLSSFIFCILSDYLINKNIISRTAGRKIFNTIAHWGAAIFLIALSYVSENFWTSEFILILAIAIGSCIYVGFGVNYIDLSPNYASIIMGITNMTANVMSLLAPLAVGVMIDDETQASEWRKVFFVSAGFYFVANLVFIIFGSGETQTWNDAENSDDLAIDDEERNNRKSVE